MTTRAYFTRTSDDGATTHICTRLTPHEILWVLEVSGHQHAEVAAAIILRHPDDLDAVVTRILPTATRDTDTRH